MLHHFFQGKIIKKRERFEEPNSKSLLSGLGWSDASQLTDAVALLSRLLQVVHPLSLLQNDSDLFQAVLPALQHIPLIPILLQCCQKAFCCCLSHFGILLSVCCYYQSLFLLLWWQQQQYCQPHVIFVQGDIISNFTKNLCLAPNDS